MAKTQEFKMTIEEVYNYAEYLFNSYNDEQKAAEKAGNNKKAFENWKSKTPYEIILCKLTGKEYVCKLPKI